MGRDLELVEFFLGHMNANELNSVSHLVSEDFYYFSDVHGYLNFEQYCHFVSLTCQNFSTEVRDIKHVGNIYNVCIELNIVDNGANYFSKIPCVAVFNIDKNKLKSIILTYDASPVDIEYLNGYKYELK